MGMTDDDADPAEALPYATVAAITGDENLLILVPSPGDESAACGGLIAQCCARGRPPFVMVLQDGSNLAPPPSIQPAATMPPALLAACHERQTRAAMARLGLPRERLLMAGLFDGTLVADGPVAEAVVRAVTLVMWARDCNVICAPWPTGADRLDATVYRIATEISARSGVGLLAYAGTEGGRVAGHAAWRLDITAQLAAKREAIAAHAARHGGSAPAAAGYELFLRPEPR